MVWIWVWVLMNGYTGLVTGVTAPLVTHVRHVQALSALCDERDGDWRRSHLGHWGACDSEVGDGNRVFRGDKGVLAVAWLKGIMVWS